MDAQAVKGVALGFYHLNIEDEELDGRHITINGKKSKFFTNCSYLGLETNPEMKKASIEAIEKFGTQFSSSRITVSQPLYHQAEDLLSEIFGKPTYLAPTTSLGHIAMIPLIMNENDAIIMDLQVHTSVKNAVQISKAEGVHTEILKHNRMDQLETRIQILRQNHERVWYLCDSIYSMFGDAAPFKEIAELLNRYEQFNVYIDDAHGMSWSGKNGRGYVLSKIPYHPRMVVVTSLAKGFGSCGGALVCYDESLRNKIRNYSTTNLFSGPLQPAILGANIASAKIHLSDEIENLQDSLFERMFFFNQTARKYGVPVVNSEMTPIYYVPVGKMEVNYKLARFLQDEGFYCMTTFFPAVPRRNSGLRITVTNHNTLQDIDAILERIGYALPKFLAEENTSMEEVYEVFGMSMPGKETAAPLERRKIA